MNRIMLSAMCLIAVVSLPAFAVSSITLSGATAISSDGYDIVFAEISENGDSIIYLKKDSLSSASSAWTFHRYNLTRATTAGSVTNASPDVFYGFSPGPANSVLYAKDADASLGSVQSIYYGDFVDGSGGLLVSAASYPAYAPTKENYNFAYVKDSNALYVAGMQSDTPSLSVSAAKILDLNDSEGSIRFPRWSADGLSIVFMVEDVRESTASIYMVSGIATLVASGTALATVSDTTTYITRITNDTYYNAFPHFVGNQHILYTRAIPYRGFKFSGFSDTGGCTSIIQTRSNWDAFMYERPTNTTLGVDTTFTTSVVSASACHRGYALFVGDSGDTEGDLTFAALQSVLNITSLSDGTYYFPANARLTLQSGAMPTCQVTVVPDTPTQNLQAKTRRGEYQAVVGVVHVRSSVPTDSMDILKTSIAVSYHDVDLTSFAEIATVAVMYDTSAAAWSSISGSLSTVNNTVTFTPTLFSTFGVGMSSTFNIVLQGSSCVIRNRGAGAMWVSALRTWRDRMMSGRLGRRLVELYYGF